MNKTYMAMQEFNYFGLKGHEVTILMTNGHMYRGRIKMAFTNAVILNEDFEDEGFGAGERQLIINPVYIEYISPTNPY